MELTAEELRNALDASRVSAVVFEHDQVLWQAAAPASVEQLPQSLPDVPLFARLRELLGIFNTENAESEPDLLPLKGFIHADVKSLLALPLASGQHLQALMFAQDVGERHFSLTEMELARTIANQASIALENARLYEFNGPHRGAFGGSQPGQCRDRWQPRTRGDLCIHLSGCRAPDAGGSICH